MDCAKVGALIRELRRERGLTQRALAEELGISAKAVSKWECGRGAPDASLWDSLSEKLGAEVTRLLQGELRSSPRDSGRLDRMRFFVCPICGSMSASTGSPAVSCCSRRLSALPVRESGAPELGIEELDGELYITIDHDMRKDHYIMFAAVLTDDGAVIHRLYPEQDAALRIARPRRGAWLYLCCTRHGLFRYRLSPAARKSSPPPQRYSRQHIE